MRKFFLLFLLSSIVQFSFAKDPADSLAILINQLDSVESSFTYQTGKINIGNGLAVLNIPPAFKYLDAQQAEKVVYDLWGNPKGEKLLGMILPADGRVLQTDSWAFIITYDEMGYVKDKDADDINYDELMQQMKKESDEANPERIQQGYSTLHMIGWAEKPYYDHERKVLYWAKEIKFGEDSLNTLNYDVRVLGRKGVLSLNAVSAMGQLAEVNRKKGEILSMVEFNAGNKYSDFDSGVDKVAAWTIGGLVAGKVLAKVGILALVLKNIKLVILGLVALGGAIWKFITGRRKKKEELSYAPVVNENNSDAGSSAH